MRRAGLIAGVILAAVIAGLSWSISSPPGSSPDEDYHLASIWCPPPVSSSGCVVTRGPDGKDLIQIQMRVVATSICYAFQPNQSGACIWDIPADAVGNDGRFDRGEYPGGYFHVMHLFVGSDPYASVYLMRGVNVVLAVLLGAFLVLAAARPTRRIFAYTVTAAYVPLGMFLVPSVNPSGWALVGVTTLAFAVHSYWLAETRGRLLANGALAVVGAAMAACARTDAIIYSGVAVVLLAALHYRRALTHRLRLLLPLVILAADFLMYLRPTDGAGVLAGAGFKGFGGLAAGYSRLQILLHNLMNLPDLLLGTTGYKMGSLGWLDTPVPSSAAIGMTMVYAFLLMAGLGSLSRWKVVMTAAALGAFVAIPLAILQIAGFLVGEAIQPRYLLPLLPVVALVVLTGARPDEAVRLRPGVAWTMWAIASMANGAALVVNIRRYTTGLDGPMIPGKAVEWWMPGLPGPLATWIGGTIAFAVAAWMVVRLSSGSDVAPIVAPGQEPLPTGAAADDESADLAAEPEVTAVVPSA